MSESQSYRVVGLMSGTSLDGLDLALCVFRKSDRWEYTIESAVTVPYDPDRKQQLSRMHQLTGEELVRQHTAFGKFLGEQVRRFLDERSTTADFVSSHGHTVFHRPDTGYTFQAGCGATLAAAAGLPVVYDFRSSDVAMGGQGAPLVPIGDRLLFSDYSACLNLGGIANVSFEQDGERRAFDVAPCNLLLNDLAERAGCPFDADGAMAARGTVQPDLLDALNRIGYYRRPFPKSLGREDVERDFLPLLTSGHSLEDQSATVCRHIAMQIAEALSRFSSGTFLVTGGGALHMHLLREIEQACGMKASTGSSDLLHFKEALVFAFLGVLRLRSEVNVLCSVTGASNDHSAGAIALP